MVDGKEKVKWKEKQIKCEVSTCIKYRKHKQPSVSPRKPHHGNCRFLQNDNGNIYILTADHTGLPNFASSETLALCWPGWPTKFIWWNEKYEDT